MPWQAAHTAGTAAAVGQCDHAGPDSAPDTRGAITHMRPVATAGGAADRPRRAVAAVSLVVRHHPVGAGRGVGDALPDRGRRAPVPTPSGAPARTAAAPCTAAPFCTPTRPAGNTCWWGRRPSGPGPPTSWSGTPAWSPGRSGWKSVPADALVQLRRPAAASGIAAQGKIISRAAGAGRAGHRAGGGAQRLHRLLLPGAGDRHLQHRDDRPVGVQQ